MTSENISSNDDGKYPYSTILEYVPVRYDIEEKAQEISRNIVFSFKSGKYANSLLEKFLRRIEEFVGDKQTDWVICFIPASTDKKTERRYGRMVQYLKKRAPCPVLPEAIRLAYDTLPSHTDFYGKREELTFMFDVNLLWKKNVIVIDDVITSGRTFERVADIIIRNGGEKVVGLFLAKTVYPKGDKIK